MRISSGHRPHVRRTAWRHRQHGIRTRDLDDRCRDARVLAHQVVDEELVDLAVLQAGRHRVLAGLRRLWHLDRRALVLTRGRRGLADDTRAHDLVLDGV